MSLARYGPPLKLFTPTTSRWKWRIDASAPRAPRAARSYRLGVQCAQRAGSTSGARSTRDAENCPQERESISHVWRLAQKAAQSSAPAEAAATWKRLAWLARRVCRLVPKYMPDEQFGRRGYYGSSSRTHSHVRAIAELGSNFDACMRAAHAGVKEKRSARLPGSLKRRVSSIMETSRNYSNAELRKVSVRDRGRECCDGGNRCESTGVG